MKIASAFVMFALAGLLIAWSRGWLFSPPKPVNVASSIDELPPEQAAEAKRIREQTQRDVAAGRVENPDS